MLVTSVLSVNDHLAFVSSEILSICSLLFLTSLEISKMAPMKKVSSSKTSFAVVNNLSR